MNNARATTSDFPRDRLPIELIRHIVADIDGDDMSPTLAACSLVCQSWADVCRPRIFQTITIDSANPVSFLSFLYFTAPHLSEYVLELTILPRTVGFCAFPTWTPDCFSRLKNLRSLEIEFNTKEPWSTLQTPLALGITTLLEAPHLRKLSMEQLHFGDDTRSLLSMLSLCSASLEDLQLCNCDAHADTNDEAHGLLPINLVALSSLRLDYVHHPVLTESLVRCPNLEAMVIGISDLRESCSLWVPSSVDHLQLIAFSWTGIPTFEKTTRISALSINRTTPDAALSDFGEWVERCIDNLPHPDLLTELTLEHAVNPTYDDHIEYPADYGAFSSSVARLLARGVIRISVSITITVDFADPEEVCQARELERLREGFAPVLGCVSVRLCVQQWSPEEDEVVLDCRV